MTLPKEVDMKRAIITIASATVTGKRLKK